MGSAIHKAVESALKVQYPEVILLDEMGRDAGTVYKSDGIELSGRPDLMFTNTIGELKSSMSIKGVPNEPKYEHIIQLIIYMKMYNKPRGCIIYVNIPRLIQAMDGPAFVEFRLKDPIDDEFEFILNKLKWVYGYVGKGELPPYPNEYLPPNKCNPWCDCKQFCPYYDPNAGERFEF